MTTIATDGKSMAGDGLACADHAITTFDRVKVSRLPDGSLLGCAGDSAHIIRFRKWLADGGSYPKVRNFAALHLQTDGSLRYYGDDPEWSAMSLPAAIGSGAAFALGAMDAQASPSWAVACASLRCPYTGGTITDLKLEPSA